MIVDPNIRVATDEFIRRARKIHGDRYDYSFSIVEDSSSTVVIIDRETNTVFFQVVAEHLDGVEPVTTAVEPVDRSGRFITRAREVHGDKYDYSLVKYVNARSCVQIICPTHGIFEQRPTDHVSKKTGCPRCAVERRVEQHQLTTEYFIERACEVHGDRYDYSLVEYVDNKTPIQIVCSEHGVFEQIPNNHTSMKAGCPQCAETGFNPSEPGTLYVLTDDKQCPTLLKIGVTNNLKQRLRQLQRRTPHPVVKLVSYPFPHGADAYKLEQEVHQVYHELNARLKGFDGATEWFKYSSEMLDYISNRYRGQSP